MTHFGQVPQLQQDLPFWSTQTTTEPDTFGEWYEMLRASHLPWTIDQKERDGFHASLSVRSFCGYKLVQCSCDSLEGFRYAKEMAQTEDAYFCVLLLRKGVEKISTRQKDMYIRANDILLWDSTQNISFEVPEPIEKTSLLIPETALTSILPHAHDYAGSIIPGNSSLGTMLNGHIMSLHKEMWNLDPENLTLLMQPTLQILATALSNDETLSETGLRYLKRRRLKSFILENLTDYELTPSKIAAALGISTRYLHILFREEGTTLSAWIKKCRLYKCREDMAASRRTGRTITEIAYRWGFNDLSHFSKSFKEEFGVSPRAFVRRQ